MTDYLNHLPEDSEDINDTESNDCDQILENKSKSHICSFDIWKKC